YEGIISDKGPFLPGSIICGIGWMHHKAITFKSYGQRPSANHQARRISSSISPVHSNSLCPSKFFDAPAQEASRLKATPCPAFRMDSSHLIPFF
ncbi:hypothetical protein, partial [Bacillus sp. JJ675]|uniref:hypothetical protein n=1 Tax=Bacillus sp. JJ675 TaxID=3122972 RepID=UPI002FFF0DD2